MEINVKVHKNRKLEVDNNYLGTVGENLATVLIFEFGKDVPDGEKWLVFNNRKGSFRFSLNENEFEIPSKVTTDTRLHVTLEIHQGAAVWYSQKLLFELSEGTDVSGKNSIQDIIENEVNTVFENSIDILDKFFSKYVKGGEDIESE